MFLFRILPKLLTFGSVFGIALLSMEGRAVAQVPLQMEGPCPDFDTTSRLFPQVPPPPLEGEKPDDQFKADSNRGPIGHYFKPMQGTDAVIELILGQGRLLRTKKPIAKEGGSASIAVGDPSVLDFEVLPNPSMIRITGKRAGVTDLSFVTSENETFNFEVRVQYDLDFLHAQLQRMFPNARILLSQIREHLILEGQARSDLEIRQIDDAVRALLASQDINLRTSGSGAGTTPLIPTQPEQQLPAQILPGLVPVEAGIESAVRPNTTTRFAEAQLINLMTVPGVKQVLLQVRIAELNRTGMREIGADTFLEFGPGNILGSRITGATINPTNFGGPANANRLTPGINTSGFGIFPSGRIEIMLRALRQNTLLRVLAEPNLVAMSGHEASFLAGGEFPVPVPQGTTGFSNVTVRFKQFGVQLNFVPHILDDDAIRLEVRPEVSTIDPSLGTTLVVGGSPVPGINTRRVHTTVQIHEGETLALAGLLQVTLEGNTQRIPGLGDLPYIGPMFSNTSHRRTERELLVLVTPFIVSPLAPCDVPPLPGEEVFDPMDFEFYFLNRIEGRTGRRNRSTLTWDDPLHIEHLFRIERANVCGPSGFTY